MSSDDKRKPKNLPQEDSTGLKRTLQGILERLRDGLDTIAEGLGHAQPRPAPIPIPVERARRK